MKDKKKEGTLGLKILAVILAVLLWIAIANVSDYQTTKEIRGIPVTQINGDVLEHLDQVYDVVSGDTVDIIVKGRRSVVGNLTAADFYASADLSTMSITNSVQIEVNAKKEDIRRDISITCYDNTLKLNLEDKVMKQFPVRVTTVGELREGFAVGDTQVSPSIVTVEGPKSTVDRITEVVVNVGVMEQHNDFDIESSVMLLDAYGEVVSSEKLSVSQGNVSVHVTVYPTKIVDLVVNLKGTPAENHAVKSVVYQPERVVIAGPSEVISQVESIEVNDVSVSGITEDVQTNIDLRDYLPDGVVVAQPATEVVLMVTVAETSDKVLKPTEKSFVLTNKQSGLVYEVTVSDDFNIVMSGFSDVVKDLTVESVKPTIDCGQLPVGNHNNVNVKLEELEGVEYSVSGSVSVLVKTADKAQSER